MSPSLRLDPSIPAFWESPEVLRFGYEQVSARIVQPSRLAERFLQRLRQGMTIDPSHGSWDELPRSEWASLLAALAPVLIDAHEGQTAPSVPSVVIRDTSDFAHALAERLGAMGCRVLSSAETSTALRNGACLVTIGNYLHASDAAQPLPQVSPQPPSQSQSLPLKEHHNVLPALPVLSIRRTDQSVWIGPFVRPGASPCARCALLHERDADPIRGVLSAQLVNRPLEPLSDDSLWRVASIMRSIVADVDEQARLSRLQLRFAVHRGVAQLVPQLHELAPHADCECASTTSEVSSLRM